LCEGNFCALAETVSAVLFEHQRQAEKMHGQVTLEHLAAQSKLSVQVPLKLAYHIFPLAGL
jgi:hypothetical protein